MNNKIVYILGAGCSAFKDGYPLAKDFRAALWGYGDTLSQRPNCERLKRCVTNTTRLMEKFQSPTVDRLALQITEELERQRQPLRSVVTSKLIELDQLEQNQILDAKRAAVAMILEREDKARKTGLQGYRDFLNIIFEGNRRPSVLETTASRVLSFNYDRLFEIAFADYFKLDSNIDCYGKAWLNSSLDFFQKRAGDFASDRFCFLKLHGTAGIFVSEQYGVLRSF